MPEEQKDTQKPPEEVEEKKEPVVYHHLRGFQIEYADSTSIKLSNGAVIIAEGSYLKIV